MIARTPICSVLPQYEPTRPLVHHSVQILGMAERATFIRRLLSDRLETSFKEVEEVS